MMITVRNIFVASIAVVITLAMSDASRTEETATIEMGDTTVTIGTGAVIFDLPKSRSMLKRVVNVLPLNILENYNVDDDFNNEIGWNINGSISTYMDGKIVTLGGFWANISHDSSFFCNVSDATEACIITPILDDPTFSQTSANDGPTTYTSASERDVDLWGISLESKMDFTPGSTDENPSPDMRYLAFGMDFRGIDQDLHTRFTDSTVPNYLVTYDEDLDTRYYGVYAAVSGTSNMFQQWGLETSIRLQGGVYFANTSYDGVMRQIGVVANADPSSSLSLSDDRAAFIGGLTLEATKRISERTTLSFTSKFEYNSSVAYMRYNDVDRWPPNPPQDEFFANGPNDGTSIDYSGALSVTTGLKLTVRW